MSHLPGDAFGAADLFVERVLGLAVFSGGLGEEQLTITIINRGRIFLIILIIHKH